MSSKGKKYNKTVKQPKIHEVYDCSHPSVIDGSMKCDGNCWHCEYHILVDTYKTF